MKKLILIFLIGIIIGVGISPLAGKLPQEAILSPISPTLAETEKKESKFADLISYLSPIKSPSPSLSPFPSLIPSPSLNPELNYLGEITIAVFGDSMIDTMETNLPYLKIALQKYYPSAEFNLFNYGMGAQNIEDGLKRIKKEYSYKERQYPSLTSLGADIIIINSFGYNPFEESEDELYRHWTSLSKIVELIKDKTSSEIIILADIAPNKQKFGEGPNGINWPKNYSWQHAVKINEYLKNTISFALSTDLTLVNSYHKTLLSNGEGDLEYINSKDHIHQNINGNKLIAKLLAEKIYSLELFKSN